MDLKINGIYLHWLWSSFLDTTQTHHLECFAKILLVFRGSVQKQTGIRNFLMVFVMITLAPWQKILSQIAFACIAASILEASNWSKITRHTKESRAVGDEQHGETRKVRPQRIAARCQKELLCAMAFQELEWHASMTSISMMRKLVF